MDIRLVEGSIFIDELRPYLGRLSAMSSEHDVIIQGVNADKVAGREHVDSAIIKAMRSMDNGTNVANDLGVEIMRYASGKRQIGEAFSIGLTEGRMNVLFIVIGETASVDNAVNDLSGSIEPSSVMPYSDSKKADIVSQFCITADELDAVGDEKIPYLVLERVALVDVLK
ncbi:KEOPS complex Cgi121-like subunit [Methanococcoides methylutens MM1]|uniref:KEOPS complex Cgi121-like subunit n=2 Tax=Methanococcoides methylutens TaxID=2226 RepID=A0A0E3STF1_METMT|nr:KEOPS complex Cgi121-like subunit [Methanococcoides methylutens MM1]